MKNILIAGSSGMIGSIILSQCLNRSDIAKVTTIVRRKSGITHPKLIEVIHDNFINFDNIISHFQNQDICFYCVGVYTGQVPKNEFIKITVDYTRIFAETLRKNSPKCTFVFLSGQGADSTEKSIILFAKQKGIAENILIKLQFEHLYIFRPGYIYPETPRKEPNLSYKLMRLLYKPVAKIYPNIGISSNKLGSEMLNTALNCDKKMIYENKDIRER